jgi:hypothetical protein
MWEAVGLTVSIGELEAHQMATSSPESRRQIGGSTVQVETPNRRVDSESTCQIGGSTALHIRKEVLKEEEEDNPPPTSSLAVDDWQAVDRALVEFGVDQVKRVIDAAKSHGCSPSHILELIAFAKTHSAQWASPPGALFTRIINARPDRPIPDGWPKSQAAGRSSIGPPTERKNPVLIQTGGKKYWSEYFDSQNPEAIA